jgi:phage baseplate assembly protein W
MATTTTHESFGAETSIQVKRNASAKFKQKYGFAYPLAGQFKAAIGTPAALKTNISEGGYFSKSYGTTLVRNNLRQLLLCEKGERVMLPKYGLSLQKYLFEPLDETTFYLIKNDILRTLQTYFSIANVISLSVFSNAVEAERSELIIKLTLQILDESLDIFDAEVTIR